MSKIKEYVMITLGALAFMLITGMAKSEEKTYTPQETLEAFSQVPGKVANHISKEWSETKEYQAESKGRGRVSDSAGVHWCSCFCAGQDW